MSKGRSVCADTSRLTPPRSKGPWSAHATRRGAILLFALAGVGVQADDADRTWCEVRTPDFDLLSDLAAERARELATALTRFKIAAQTLVPRRQAPAPPPLKIVAFRRARDFQRVFAVRRIAGFMQSALEQHTLAFGPNAVGPIGHGRFITQTAFHEYTHYLLRSRQGINYPIWYEEGFASFLSTMRIGDDAVTVGAVPLSRFREMNATRMTVRELVGERFQLDWARHDLTRLYAQAWLLVHMLQLGDAGDLPPYHERIPDMLAMIDSGVPAAQAMEEALGTGPDTLQRQVRAYGGKRALPTRRLAVAAGDIPPFEERCLEPDEARYQLAMAAVTRNPEYARQLFTRVLAAQPEDLDALVGLSLAEEDLAPARAAVVRALGIDANHSAANVRMAQLKVAECRGNTTEECLDVWDEGVRYYRLGLRNQPDSVGAAYGLGVVYLHTGQPGDAVNYLRVAYRRAPWAPRVNFYLGEAYRLTGDRVRARVHLNKAMHWDSNEQRRERAAMALALMGL